MADIGSTQNEGEYPQPFTQVTNVHMPMVSGYTTGRLYGRVFKVSGYDPQETQVLMTNHGTTSITVQMRETDDYVSGPHTNIGPAVALVPSGQKTVNILPIRNYLEFKSTAGDGQLRVQIASRVKWNEMAFDKRGDVARGTYPPSLTQRATDDSPFPS
jgi:hypothetical protein